MPVKIEKILCPFDLAHDAAERMVLPLRIAGAFQARIEFFFVLENGNPAELDSAERRLSRLVEKVYWRISKTREARPINRSVAVSNAENVDREIISEAARFRSDLIILSAGRSTSDGICTLGPIFETICRAAPCSVLVTRPNGHYGPDKKDPSIFQRILVAYDFSDDSELALQSAELFGEKFQAEAQFLHVLSEPLYKNIEPVRWPEAAGKLYHRTIQRLRTAIAAESGKFRSVTVAARWGKIYREILKYADEQRIDLILVGAHGADFGKGALFGSNTDRILRQAAQAVLIGRPLQVACSPAAPEISRSHAKQKSAGRSPDI